MCRTQGRGTVCTQKMGCPGSPGASPSLALCRLGDILLPGEVMAVSQHKLLHSTPTGWIGNPLDSKLQNLLESEPSKHGCEALEPLELFGGLQCGK